MKTEMEHGDILLRAKARLKAAVIERKAAGERQISPGYVPELVEEIERLRACVQLFRLGLRTESESVPDAAGADQAFRKAVAMSDYLDAVPVQSVAVDSEPEVANKHLGQPFSDYLDDESIREEVEAATQLRVDRWMQDRIQ